MSVILVCTIGQQNLVLTELQDWTSAAPSLMLNRYELTVVNRFSYLGSCVTKGDNTTVQMSMGVYKARIGWIDPGE